MMQPILFATKHNNIILYKHLSNPPEKTLCMSWPGMHPIKNLHDLDTGSASKMQRESLLCKVGHFSITFCNATIHLRPQQVRSVV